MTPNEDSNVDARAIEEQTATFQSLIDNAAMERKMDEDN